MNLTSPAGWRRWRRRPATGPDPAEVLAPLTGPALAEYAAGAAQNARQAATGLAQAADALHTAEPAVRNAAETLRTVMGCASPTDRIPDGLLYRPYGGPADTERATQQLRAVVSPTGALPKGVYRVTYDRVGGHGRRGTPAPPPLTATITGPDDLEQAIAADTAHYLDGMVPQVVVDRQARGGFITAGSRRAGSFTYTLISHHHAAAAVQSMTDAGRADQTDREAS